MIITISTGTATAGGVRLPPAQTARTTIYSRVSVTVAADVCSIKSATYGVGVSRLDLLTPSLACLILAGADMLHDACTTPTPS